MHDHNLDEMAAAVADHIYSRLPLAPIAKVHVSELVRTALAEYWKDKLALVWDVDDVKTQAKEQGYRLDDELAREVLSRCLHKHDATLGLSWDVIQVHIGDVARENGLSREDEDELLDDEAECAWCHSTFLKAEGFQRGSESLCPECAK